ncbi:Basic-leucine zipper (bZIP) transcription factor [Cordyceps militaris]|uniref:Basic-leucine zipper (BZIP) transcription factor n=1 Tax=Cordyceps militaris TaxID=73501 RepID=A0A2H4S8Y5_CORMI|nr:Basic-leucine zipper (bZIP) transcription factor [Cordyceps militaris]
MPQPGLAQEANHNLRPWDQQPPQVPAAPASSSSSERHAGIHSCSAWGDDADAGGAYESFFLPEQFANLQQDPVWWSPDNAFLDADLDWAVADDELQCAFTTAAATAALTTLAVVPELPVRAPALAPTMPTPGDWSGFGVFDSNTPTTTTSSGDGASAHPTPAASSYPRLTSVSRRKHVDPEMLLKRQRNKVAAQKYRQKKLDRIAELEGEVTDVRRERDELRIQLAKQEAETAALRDMLKLINPGSGLTDES